MKKDWKKFDSMNLQQLYVEETKKFITAVRRGEWYKLGRLKENINKLFKALQLQKQQDNNEWALN